MAMWSIQNRRKESEETSLAFFIRNLSNFWTRHGVASPQGCTMRCRRLPLWLNSIRPSSGFLRVLGHLDPLKWGPIASTETSVLNRPRLRYNPEDGRIQETT
jgi:hypothetical protein